MEFHRPEAAQNSPLHFDVVVIGADIQGVSMANEAAGRGLKTAIIDNRCTSPPQGRRHLCSGESVELVSNLSFLENFQLPEFLCAQNELARLYQLAPHLVTPISAFAVEDDRYRSATKLAFGAALHQRMTSKHFPSAVQARPASEVLDGKHFNSNSITLCQVNFQRVTKQLLKRSEELGVKLLMEHELAGAQREKPHWTLQVKSHAFKNTKELKARALINCCGVETQNVLEHTLRVNSRSGIEQVFEGQLLIRSDWPDQSGKYVSAIQTENDGWMYVSPFDEKHVCVSALIANNESEMQNTVDNALNIWNATFAKKISEKDIALETWSARAVVDDPSTSRNFRHRTMLLDLNHFDGHAPILNVLGYSPISFYKKARQGLDILANYTGKEEQSSHQVFSITPSYDGNVHCLDSVQFKVWANQWQDRVNFLHEDISDRLIHAYGTDAMDIMGDAKCVDDLGQHFGAGLYEREVLYLLQKEKATSANDILWRHSYLGLYFSDDQVRALEDYVKHIRSAQAVASSA